jgi:hypothetical protein
LEPSREARDLQSEGSERTIEIVRAGKPNHFERAAR